MNERRQRIILLLVIPALFLFSGCRSPQRSARPDNQTLILGWLTCEECIAGERDSVRALGAAAVSSLAAVFDSVPSLITEPLRIRLTNRWTPEYHPDRDTYVNTYVRNAETIARVRAAYSLGDLRAQSELQDALTLATSRGYGPDVIQAIRGALAAASGTGSPARAIRVEPDTLAMLVGSENQLAVFVEDSAGNLLNPDVLWTSSNTQVLSTGTDGRLTAVSNGQAVIRATVVNTQLSDSSRVTVSEAAPPSAGLSLQIMDGNHQSRPSGAVLPDRLSVRVTQSGQPVSGIVVDWRVLLGAGTLTSAGGGRGGGTPGNLAKSTTDASGTANATWRLGPEPGPQRVEARIAGAPAVVFRATAN